MNLTFEQLKAQYLRDKKNNFVNNLNINNDNITSVIRSIEPLLNAPNGTVLSTLEKMLKGDNKSGYFDYTTTAYYLLEKLYNDNENVKQVCRTYSNFASNCDPLFTFETKDKKNFNLISTLSSLFDNPNNNETWLQIVRKTYASMVLFGNAYWQVRYTRNGNIYGIYYIPSSSIRPVPYLDEITGDLRFVYCQISSNNGFDYKVSKVFSDEEIIPFKTDNPFSLTYGLSEFAPLFKNLQFDESKSIYINNYLKNSYSGGMIFEIKDTDKEIVERNREELIELLSGVENAGRNMILEGNIRLVTDGNKTKDFPLSQLSEINRDTIFTTAGVPLTMAGIRSEQGKLNAELVQSEEQVFLRNIETYQSILFDNINNHLIKKILKKEGLKIVSGVNKHFNLKNAESIVSTLLKIGCTINEAREKLGFAKMTDETIGNMLIIGTNNGVIPLETFFENLKLDIEKKKLEIENFDTVSKSSSNTTGKPPSLKVSTDNIKID